MKKKSSITDRALTSILIKTPESEVAFLARSKKVDKDTIFPAFLNLGFLSMLYSGYGFVITAANKEKQMSIEVKALHNYYNKK